MKKQVLVGTIIVTFVILTDAKRTNHDNDGDMDSFEQSLVRRYFLNKYLSLEDRDAPSFTDDQRKFQNDSLVTHNLLRARHCVPPLVLDDDINAKAQAYAEVLASNDVGLIHSDNRGGLLGENLYSLTRTTPIPYSEADKSARAWYAEIANYDFNQPGFALNVGHFTQVVWKSTQRLGIGYAFAREQRKMYVTAQYGPSGNLLSEFAANVLQPTC